MISNHCYTFSGPKRGKIAFGQALGLCEDAKGNTAIEFALIGLALVMATAGLMQGGELLWTQSALHYAVEEAARCASIDTNNCATTSQVQSFAAARSGAGFSATVFTVTTPSCGNQVSASYDMQLIFPVTSSITLTAQACYPTMS